METTTNVEVMVTDLMKEHLDTLLETGLFGLSYAECIERLAARAMVQLAEDGWLPQPCDDDG